MNSISIGKGFMLLFWLLELLNLFQVFGQPFRQYLHVATVMLLGAHLLEATVFTRLYGTQLVEPKFHKMQIMIFGLFHWLELHRSGRIRMPSRRNR